MSAGPFRLGIIGAGGISGAHAAAVKAAPDRLSLAAVVDPSAEARQKLADDFGAKVFADAADLLDAHSRAGKPGLVDGLVVCTPPNHRIGIIGAALKAGVPVLSEKPLAHTLADAKKLEALARRYRRVPAYVGYCHRFTPAIKRMQDLVREGRIGRLHRVENFFACDLPGHEKKWFSDLRKSGGGAYLDMGSHSVDLLHTLIGPCRTLGAVYDHKWRGRAETGATVLLRSQKKSGSNIPAGVAGIIISGWAESSRFTLTLVGDGGSLSYDYEKPEELVFRSLEGKAEVSTVESCGVRFLLQLLAFADAARSRVRTPLATFADGLASAKLAAEANRLAR